MTSLNDEFKAPLTNVETFVSLVPKPPLSTAGPCLDQGLAIRSVDVYAPGLRMESAACSVFKSTPPT